MPVIEQVASGFPADDPPGCPLIGWHSLVTISNVSSTTADTDFPITNVANPATHLKWVGGVNTGDEYITITTSSSTMNYVGVAGHNWGSQAIPVSVEFDDGGGFVEVIAPQTLDDDTPIIFRFTHGASSPAIAAVRIKLAVSDSGIPPEAAVVYAGELLVLERSIKIDTGHVPIPFGRRTNIINGMSESGNFLGRIVLGEYRDSKAAFTWFTPDFYRSDIDEFLAAAQETPFFWAWNPLEYPDETGYVWLINNAEPEVDPVTRRIALELEMRGIA